MSEAAVQYSGMSRSEFIKQMGLTEADTAPPTASGSNSASHSPSHPSGTNGASDSAAAPPMEPELVIEDDTWVRNTVFLDPSVIAEEQSNTNELRQTLLEEYRVRATATNQRAIAGELEEKPRDVLADVTPERRREAADYKAHLLQQYLNRKANQETSPNK